MPALEDLIRGELLDAADQGQPDMTRSEVEALATRLATTLGPHLLGQPTTRGRPRTGRHRPDAPTRRHVQILELFAVDASVTDIAAQFAIDVRTVGHHMRSLARRWEMPAEPCQLVNAGFERGWLSLPVPFAVADVDARDLTMLGLLAGGRGDEAGEVLGLSRAMVVRERHRLMGRLGARTDAGLVAAAWRAGVLPVAPPGVRAPHS